LFEVKNSYYLKECEMIMQATDFQIVFRVDGETYKQKIETTYEQERQEILEDFTGRPVEFVSVQLTDEAEEKFGSVIP
jgi:hypothetical protein